ncbi:MAG: FxLYD domain-containing protein, partial [Dehalococcoidia bacterium]|nr:FxLYD domain-containing protein [Dehalococcoidia bacterium]
MLRRLLILLVATTLLPGSALAAPRAEDRASLAWAQTTAGLRVTGWRQYDFQRQIYWVVGEVRNEGAQTVANPVVQARFVDAFGAPVLDVETPLDASALAPGQSATFRVTVENPAVPVRIAALHPRGVVTDQAPAPGLAVIASTGAYQEIERDELRTQPNCDPDVRQDCFFVERVRVRTDNFVVDGTVVNLAPTAAANVRVMVALY